MSTADTEAFEAVSGLLEVMQRGAPVGHQLRSVTVDGPERHWTLHCECGWTAEPSGNLAVARTAFVAHRGGVSN